MSVESESDLAATVEVRNEARVHLWYESKCIENLAKTAITVSDIEM